MKPIILKLARDDLKEINERLKGFGNVPPKKFKDSFALFCDNVTRMPSPKSPVGGHRKHPPTRL